MVSPVERKRLGTINFYLPRAQLFATANSAYRAGGTGRVALPDVASKTTLSHGQAMQGAAKFGWTHLDTPILVWHEDKIRAGNEGTKEGQSIAMGQLIDEATEVAIQDHLDKLATDVWTGNPSSQSADLWDAPLGLVQAVDTANTYGNVDRSTEALWRAQKDTTFTAVDITKIIDDANLTKSVRVKGRGVNCILTTTALYQQFKAQILSQGGVVLQNGPLQKFAKMGVTMEVLQKDNCYITYDPNCPASNVFALDTSVFKFMLHPQFNFKTTPFVDNTKTGIAKEAYDYAYLQSRFMLTCDNPFLQVRYTAIGT
jgi:hypothetical protein